MAADLANLARFVRLLGKEARRHLDTYRGFPTHPRVNAAELRRLRRRLKSPDPAARAEAVDALRRRIIGA